LIIETDAFDEPSAPQPAGFQLMTNYPNPFNLETTIRFRLIRSGHVRLNVYNILGQKVRTLINTQLDVGHHAVSWDGRDDSGDIAASGVYFYRIETAQGIKSRKMILMK
jgi:hypothetical protein